VDHFIRDCPRPKKPLQGQNSNQNNQGKGKKRVMQVRQGQVNFTTLAELPEGALWQNCSNYSGSSALLIALQLHSAQRTSNGTILWSVGSPPDATTVQQDRSRFTSHEGEFTSQNSSSTFKLQSYIHYYKPSSKISKLLQTIFS
jgi:hypothetical protein